MDGLANGILLGTGIGLVAGAIAGLAADVVTSAKVVSQASIMLGQSMTNVTAAAGAAGAGIYGGLHSYQFLNAISPTLANFFGNMSNMLWLSNNINAGKEILSIGYMPGSTSPTNYTAELLLIIEKGKEIIEYVWNWITK